MPMKSTASRGDATNKPKNLAPCLVAAFKVMAFSRSSLGTWLGIRAWTAGSWVARNTPLAKASAARCHNSRIPAIVNAAARVVTTPLDKKVAIASLRRSNLSAISPATGDTIRNGIIPENAMIPTQPLESERSRTNHADATMNVHMAPPENMFAAHMRR